MRISAMPGTSPKTGPVPGPVNQPGPVDTPENKKDPRAEQDKVRRSNIIGLPPGQVDESLSAEEDKKREEQEVDGSLVSGEGTDDSAPAECDHDYGKDDDGDPSQDVVRTEASFTLGSIGRRLVSVEVEEGLPIRVYKGSDGQYLCDTPQCAIGHESNKLSDAIAKRDNFVKSLAQWLQDNRQNFLKSFDVNDLSPDSYENACAEIKYVLENGEGCPVTQKGLLELLGHLGDKDKGKSRNAKNADASDVSVGASDFSRYKKSLCLRSDDLGKELFIDVLFSREAKINWAVAVVRGFVKDQDETLTTKEQILEYIGGFIQGTITAQTQAENKMINLIRPLMQVLQMRYDDIINAI